MKQKTLFAAALDELLVGKTTEERLCEIRNRGTQNPSDYAGMAHLPSRQLVLLRFRSPDRLPPKPVQVFS